MPRRSMSPSMLRLDRGERHAARGGDVGDAGHQAGAERVEQELDGRRGLVGADEHGRVVGVVREGSSCACGRRRRRRTARSSCGCACRRPSGSWPGSGTARARAGCGPRRSCRRGSGRPRRSGRAVGGGARHGLLLCGVSCRHAPTMRDPGASGLGDHLESIWRSSGDRRREPSWAGDLRVRRVRDRHRPLRAARRGRAAPRRAAGLRRAALPRRAPRPRRRRRRSCSTTSGATGSSASRR